MEIDKGRLSTVLATIAIIVLGVFIAQPDLLQQLLGQELYLKYGAIIIALLIAVFNYVNPRTNPPVEEPVKTEEDSA